VVAAGALGFVSNCLILGHLQTLPFCAEDGSGHLDDPKRSGRRKQAQDFFKLERLVWLWL
jgi:hypothetical protein